VHITICKSCGEVVAQHESPFGVNEGNVFCVQCANMYGYPIKANVECFWCGETITENPVEVRVANPKNKVFYHEECWNAEFNPLNVGEFYE
jgi:formylmethanofuran dehydrogenase subunit E